MSNQVEKRILVLREQIKEHEYNYYVLVEPKISDHDFDQLLKELEELEQQQPELITPDSPTQRVGSDLTKEIKPVQHKLPMLSLSNTYNEDELYEFDRRIHDQLKIDNEIEYVTELKLDGASVSLTYINGMLTTAATRGDGEVGEEITPNVRTIRAIPLNIDITKIKKYDLNNIEIRGEIFMEINAFKKLNEERKKYDLPLFANPRNSTAGTLKLQDPRLVSQRPLDIFVYYLLSSEVGFNTQFGNLELLADLGFKVNKYRKLCKNIDDVIAFCREWENKREELPYEIDGVVVKLNSINYQLQLGNIAKSPRWAVAYKFKAKQAVTKLKSITWQVGRTGTLTPVANLEPVKLAGSTISRATLHNIDEIQRKGIREGDKVIIEKGGDVIPKIVSVVEQLENSIKIKIPERCPVCNTKLFKSKDEVAIYCENYECSAQIKGRIAHFAARGAMDIEGLGYSLIDRFVDMGILKSYADIYMLDTYKDKLIEEEGLGEKSISKLLKAIEKSKERPLQKVLFALGIRYVGAGAAQKLARHFKSLDKLMEASEKEIESVPDIGPSISNSITRFFSDQINIDHMERLKLTGLRLSVSEDNVVSNILENKTFVLTGTLSTLTREKAKEMIENVGGKVSSIVSKKTDYVVVGENPGSKYSKARELNIEILSETEFKKLLIL